MKYIGELSLTLALLIPCGDVLFCRTWMDLIISAVAFLMCLMVYSVVEGKVQREQKL